MAKNHYVACVLRATLQSCQGPITLRQFNRDYRELEGEDIPYAKMGYRSLEEFMKDTPEVILTKDYCGEIKVDIVPNDNTRHLVELVARQKKVTRKTTRSSHHSHMPRYESCRRPAPSYSRPASSYSYNKYNPNYRQVTQTYRPPERPPPVKQVKGPALTAVDLGPASGTAPTHAKPPSNSVGTSNSAVAPVKTPVTERKYNKLSMTARLQAGMLPDETTQPSSATAATPAAPAPTPKSNRASGRLSNLRSSLHTLDVIPLQLPAAAQQPPSASVTPSALTASSAPYTEVQDSLPSGATAQERLVWMCRKLSLPEPVYKMNDYMKDSKSRPASFLCMVKVGGNYQASTYPDSSPSADMARELAAMKLLAQLESLATPGLTTSAPAIALARVAELVAADQNYLWASTVPHLYREKYKENLPSDWQDLVESSSKFNTDRGANGQLMILVNTLQTDGSLVLPDEDIWNVFVTVVNSTIEVWLRLIGDQYSNAYHNMMTDMENFYNSSGSAVTSVEVSTWYAVQLEEGWHRGQLVEVAQEEAIVFLVDHGDEELVRLSALRPLAPRFHQLPAQAIHCRLDKMEELGASEVGAEVARELLVGRVLVAVPGDTGVADGVPVLLYDTTDHPHDVDLNQQILQDICDRSKLNITDELCGVEVGCVSAEGQVWLVSGAGVHLVRKAFDILTADGPYARPLPPLPPTRVPEPNLLYAVQSYDKQWLRCVVRAEVADDGTVSMRLVDSGQTMRVPLASLVPLHQYSHVLARLPYQAKSVHLGKAQSVAGEMVSKLRQLLLDTAVLCRIQPSAGPPAAPASPTAPPAEPVVDLFVRTGPLNSLVSVNSTILFDFEDAQKATTEPTEERKNNPLEALNRKKERILSRTLSQQNRPLPAITLPCSTDWVNVLITMAANPWHFVVQLTSSRKQLSEMMVQLQERCPHLAEPEPPLAPANSDFYVLFYDKDNSWYRVVVVNVVSRDIVSVYFCDFGDLALVPAADLRRVPDSVPLARTLPPQAIKAKLYGVRPLHQDWSPEDCVRFQELTVNQEFAAKVREVEPDPVNPAERLLVVDLVDTSTNEDIYLNCQLEKEQRAKLTAGAAPHLAAA